MKHIPAILFLLMFACSSPSAINDTVSYSDLNGFKGLLQLCERDLKAAAGVIEDKDIVASLSHLLFMASGGTKYYILEKKNITKVLQSVTEGIYNDFILINSRGTIVYSRTNNEILGKNVRTTLKGSPFHTCYQSKDIISFTGLSPFPDMSRQHYFFATIKIKGDSLSSGYFILQLPKEKILKFFNSDTTAVDMNGTITISGNPLKIGVPYSNFIPIRKKAENIKKGTRLKMPNGKRIVVSRFTYRNIDWVLLEE